MVEEIPPVDPESIASNTAFLAEMERKRAAQNKTPAAEEYVIPTQPRWKQKISENSNTTQSGIIGFILRHGVAKDEQQANIILIGMLVATVGLIAYVLWPSGSKQANNPPPFGAPSATTQLIPTP